MQLRYIAAYLVVQSTVIMAAIALLTGENLVSFTLIGFAAGIATGLVTYVVGSSGKSKLKW